MTRTASCTEAEPGSASALFQEVAWHRDPASGAGTAFYLELAREAGGPVLELGCGSGRVLLEIARAGFPCSGIDASAGLLGALRRRGLPASLRLACAPLHRFELGPDRFTLIYSALRGFQQLLTAADQLACLARVRRHLAPGGLFAFDVPNPGRGAGGASPAEESPELRLTHDGEDLVCHTRVERDPVAQRLRVRRRYERWRAGELLDSESTACELRYFFRFELEHLLARAGFEQVACYGDFQRAALTADNGFVIVARA